MRRDGFLLLADNTLPSVATLVAGERIHGSWWGHARGHAIFQLAGRLGGHRDSLVLRLVSDKLAFVHRRVWPAVLAVAESESDWQTRDLTRAARTLLATIESESEGVATGPAARLLESRWLVRGEQVHTTLGSHARHLETWAKWAARARVEKYGSCEAAQLVLENIVASVNEKSTGHARLPWQGRVRRVTPPVDE